MKITYMSFLKRRLLPSMLVKELPEIKVILISHTHPDHCDFDALDKMSRTSNVIMPEGISSKVRKMGFNVKELKYGNPSDFINCIRDERIRKTVKVLDAGESFEY